MENLAVSTAATLIATTLVICFIIANAKSLPFAHSFRLLPSFYRLLHPRLFPAPRTEGLLESDLALSPDSGSATVAAQTILFKHTITGSRAVLLDLDINLHKSNSTFFADADINRAELLTRLLSRGLAATRSPTSTLPAIPQLAAVQCTFKREIGPFQTYSIASRILTWDDRSLFLVTYFLSPGTELPIGMEITGGPTAVLADPDLRRCIYAVMVTRYVCKAGRETVAPVKILEAAGILVPRAKISGVENHAALMKAEDVGKAVESGRQYVRESPSSQTE